jgi:hypothetical protein
MNSHLFADTYQFLTEPWLTTTNRVEIEWKVASKWSSGENDAIRKEGLFQTLRDTFPFVVDRCVPHDMSVKDHDLEWLLYAIGSTDDKSNHHAEDRQVGADLVIPENTRVLCVGDLHGSLSNLMTILHHLQRQGIMGKDGVVKDGFVLVFLGDVVDRGQHSYPCLFLILLLYAIHHQATSMHHKRVLFARGNHEETNAIWKKSQQSFHDQLTARGATDRTEDLLMNLLQRIPVVYRLQFVQSRRTLMLHHGAGVVRTMPPVEDAMVLMTPQYFLVSKDVAHELLTSDLVWKYSTDPTRTVQTSETMAQVLAGWNADALVRGHTDDLFTSFLTVQPRILLHLPSKSWYNEYTNELFRSQPSLTMMMKFVDKLPLGHMHPPPSQPIEPIPLSAKHQKKVWGQVFDGSRPLPWLHDHDKMIQSVWTNSDDSTHSFSSRVWLTHPYPDLFTSVVTTSSNKILGACALVCVSTQDLKRDLFQ